MNRLFSDRILNTPSSFIREILKVTDSNDIISFAGGLPNPISFPENALMKSADRVIHTFHDKVFQYASTEGYLPLRAYIAERYQQRFQLDISAEDILITSGSQQALDLIGKVLLNKGDALAIEKPGYLGAIQSFCMWEPSFLEIDLLEDGLDTAMLEHTLKENKVKLLYTVPNFQNPTGITYSQNTRRKICELLKTRETFLIEDDPYGDLRFEGSDLPYIGAGILPNSILLGSISKIITPGIRLGWICTKNHELMNHLIVAKQASDLHSNIFSQYMVYDYLTSNNLIEHISQIKNLYHLQKNAMIDAIKMYWPKEVTYTNPDGGMFIWASLPSRYSSLDLFTLSQKEKVVFVPGNPFYISASQVPSFRLNYTNSDIDSIQEGIKRIGKVMDDTINKTL